MICGLTQYGVSYVLDFLNSLFIAVFSINCVTLQTLELLFPLSLMLWISLGWGYPTFGQLEAICCVG